MRDCIPTHLFALIGTGLTGVDVVLRLRELGHRGRIIAVSRHGIFPNRHDDYTPLSSSAIPSDTPATCVAYLRVLHAAVRGGAEWRAAIDSLREATNELWVRLPLEEKKRFRRHLQRRWDVVRHRMAPPIADVIESELRSGTLEIREGHLKAVDASPAGAHITLRAHGNSESFYADRVINCTGPSMNYRRVPSTLLQNLFKRGLVTSGPLGTGFHCSQDGAVIDAGGHTSEVIFNLGPGRLGDLLESIAVPEIRQEAVELASTLADRMRQQYVFVEKTMTETAARGVSRRVGSGMTTATVTNIRGTERAVTSWLASAIWAVVLGAASGSACVAVRLFFRFLQWIFVQQTGMLPIAAATLSPARRIVTPIIGAALATLVIWMRRRLAPDLRFEEYVEAVRLRNGRVPLLSTILADCFLCLFRGHWCGDRARRIDDPIGHCNLLMGRRAIAPTESVVIAAGGIWRRSRGGGSLSGTDRRSVLRNRDRPG